MKTKLYWHIHHDILCELLTEPLENRIKYIRKHKPANEVKLRLRLIKPVQGQLPKEIILAGAAFVKAKAAWDKAEAAWGADAAWDKAEAAWDKAEAACVKAEAACVKAGEKHLSEIEVLHALECPNCPWDGKTIFSNKGK